MPRDPLAFIGYPDLFIKESDITEVHVSVAFSWDKEEGERLRDAWDKIAPAKLGGPAFGDRHGEFIRGKYLVDGYTITSRGCPRRCWFCDVWKYNPQVNLLPMVDGWKIQDDNLLATPPEHFRSVIQMLNRQPHGPEFTGGLEALLLKEWHVNEMAKLTRVATAFFAYDPGDEYDDMVRAAKWMQEANICGKGHRLRCYVLIGFKKDTLAEAEKRLESMRDLGYTPMAMLYRDPRTGAARSDEWRRFQRLWARPAIIYGKKKR